MTYKKLQNNILYLTNSEPDSPIITLTDDFKDIWLSLETLSIPEVDGADVSIHPDILSFLKTLNDLNFLPAGVALEQAMKSVTQYLGKTPSGKFEIQQAQPPLDISAGWVEDAYEEWYCSGFCATAQPPKK